MRIFSTIKLYSFKMVSNMVKIIIQKYEPNLTFIAIIVAKTTIV